jgi:hypothetical protein
MGHLPIHTLFHNSLIMTKVECHLVFCGMLYLAILITTVSVFLRKNDVSGFPTIPRKLKQCDACILGKYNNQPFHDSTSRACRKLELIHSDLCGLMLVPFANVNKYIMTFVDDYTRMCWVYLLKDKSQAFETFKNFHVWIQNET